MDEVDAAEAMRLRLQGDLRVAMKRREAREVAVLRALITAIDNAGAVAPPPGAGEDGSGVERRRLSPADIEALLAREHAERDAAASEFARLGLAAESELARREMALVERYRGGD